MYTAIIINTAFCGFLGGVQGVGNLIVLGRGTKSVINTRYAHKTNIPGLGKVVVYCIHLCRVRPRII